MGVYCIVKSCNNKQGRPGNTMMFHRIPTKNADLMKQWLLALDIDPHTPVATIKGYRVCSEHFREDDYFHKMEFATRTMKRVLKDTAIPSIVQTGQSGSPAATDEPSDLQLDLPEVEDASSLFAGVPHSTPRKTCTAPTAEFKSPLTLKLTSPAQTATGTKPMIALAPSWTHQLDTATSSKMMATCRPKKSIIFHETPQIDTCEMDISSATSALDISMASEPASEPAADPADSSFVPDTSPSTSTTGSTASIPGQYRGWTERKWLVNESKLMELFQKCTFCGAAMCDVNQIVKTSGSMIRIIWKCDNGHTGDWESCPTVRGMAENNLLSAAATLFTGATYTDIAEWAGVLNLQLPQKTTYYRIQSSYLIPVIAEEYKKQEDTIKARLICQTLDGEGVQVCGDGRSDSPGHSCKYTTYSFMDDFTNQIVTFELIQVTQAKSSVAMEPMGFKKGLEKLLDEGIHVKVVTTDRHPSIRKIMREDFPNIEHQFDPWHTAKAIKKKLVLASNRKNCMDLAPWIKSVSNHMWWSCSSSKGDTKELLRRWRSILHHICGVHRWEEDGMIYKCYHTELPADVQRKKKWLAEDSPAYKALYEVCMNARLLKDLEQMALFKHTGMFIKDFTASDLATYILVSVVTISVKLVYNVLGGNIAQ
nr:uncharacterized protein si:dkeyp-30e7.2 isoform X1 [Misgurnus anguillicaudatus]